MIIACDFDGTLAIHEYPNIGDEVPLAIITCLQLIEDGHKLILYTMRAGQELENAVQWCKERGLEFWAHNDNPDQQSWTTSRKVYAHLYIDDAAFGCPLVYREGSRPFVCWTTVYDVIKRMESK